MNTAVQKEPPTLDNLFASIHLSRETILIRSGLGLYVGLPYRVKLGKVISHGLFSGRFDDDVGRIDINEIVATCYCEIVKRVTGRECLEEQVESYVNKAKDESVVIAITPNLGLNKLEEILCSVKEEIAAIGNKMGFICADLDNERVGVEAHSFMPVQHDLWLAYRVIERHVESIIVDKYRQSNLAKSTKNSEGAE